MITNQNIEGDAKAEQQVLVAHVHSDGPLYSDDPLCIVRADEVGKALATLHGTPEHGLRVKVRIEYVLMPAALLAEMEEFDRSGQQHCG